MFSQRKRWARQDRCQRKEAILHRREDCVPTEEEKLGQKLWGKTSKDKTSFGFLPEFHQCWGWVAGVLYWVRSPKDLPGSLSLWLYSSVEFMQNFKHTIGQ